MKPFRLWPAAVAWLLLAVAPVSARETEAGAASWETAELPRPQSRPGVEVMTAGQWVYVSAPRSVKVSLLTVLGQPLTEAVLPAGVYRFRLASRGVYILRVASYTYRITL